ncbi:MAG: ANTAR domain-containing protein [Eubacteriales bacterium]|nr:ANTAR domain-containing protein [Eubacteriales bacterium]MDD4461839.1 ANTAR domain-containing protein [Eubacteriales bacterium]
MENALVVALSEKSLTFFSEILLSASIHPIATVNSCGEARRMLLQRDFDLVIINAPLRDETGENLSRHIAAKGVSQVILVVPAEHYEAISAQTEEFGVLTVARPLNRSLFWSALKLAKSAGSRLKRMREENSRLVQKIEDIRLIDRAKYCLISYLSLSEQEAHRFIEKQAMDLRTTKRAIAEGILKTYEN